MRAWSMLITVEYASTSAAPRPIVIAYRGDARDPVYDDEAAIVLHWPTDVPLPNPGDELRLEVSPLQMEPIDDAIEADPDEDRDYPEDAWRQFEVEAEPDPDEYVEDTLVERKS